ncbi:MAG: LysR family transcriptional regulator [Streptosporangiaceae bacterium]
MNSDQWRGIELRHLVALQAVAEEGSFHAAADRLGYTQSAISQQIAALERIIGDTLIERPGGPRKISLTDAGRLVLGHAQAIIARLQAAQADTAAIASGGLGKLRVGTYQSTGEKILPALMPRFAAARPGVEVSLIESESDDELLACIERGELDLAFALLPLPAGPFACAELMRDPWMLLVTAGSPLAVRREPVPLHEAAGLPLIGARLRRCRMHVDAYFDARELTPQYVFRTDENGLVHGLVAAGMGVGIVPQLTIDPRDERVTAVQLGPGLPPRVIALAWHRDRHQSPAAEAFITMARELCATPVELPTC